MDKITVHIVVRGGCVNGVYMSAEHRGKVEAKVLDLDNISYNIYADEAQVEDAWDLNDRFLTDPGFIDILSDS